MSDPAELNARITREEFAHYENLVKPVEDQYLSNIGQGLPEQLDQADDFTDEAFDSAEEINDRNLSRYGLTESADAARLSQRRAGLDRARTSTAMRGKVRQDFADRELDALTSAVALGRNIAANTHSGANQVAGMASRREATNRQLEAQGKAGQFGLAGTGAGIGMMVGGPVGGLVGGAIGYGLGELF